ncbi:hypothetical protein D9M73_166910 [compost metagenome]
MNAGGVERPVNLGGEFAITEERRHAGSLGFRAAETEFPLIAGAVGDFLFAARLQIGQRNVVGLDLFRGQARPDPFTAHGDALLFQLRTLLRGHLALDLTEDQLQVRHILLIDLHVARGQLPQSRLQHLRVSRHRKCQTQCHGQTQQTNVHRVTPDQ